ncbi:MAG TPA: hypothetical protein GXX29_13255 [Firmicutes bacterium]|nr:hypothetical protein [Bacillota bacterium]
MCFGFGFGIFASSQAAQAAQSVHAANAAPASAEPFIRLPGKAADGTTWDYDPVLDPDIVVPPADAVRVVVTNGAELREALAAAAPGQIIELADGIYEYGGTYLVRGVRATKSAPLIIRAQNQGKAVIGGKSSFIVQESSYVVISGLKFTASDEYNTPGLRLRSSSHCRVTRNHFALVESPAVLESRHWVDISGTAADYNRIDHNLFEQKRRLGNFISINGDNVQVAQHTRVDRNHFRDVKSVNHNGMEAIRIGTSTVSRSHAFTIIEHNLFERCNGEIEIITVKSGGNHIRYNTFLECEGAVTFRHGNDNQAYGNFFLGNNKPSTGGIRVYGRGHKIYNNHFENLAGTDSRSALSIGVADNAYQQQVLDYWRVERLLVIHNTFVNNASSIAILSDSRYPYSAVDTVIANNLIISNKLGNLVNVAKAADITWIGNMMMNTRVNTAIGIDLTANDNRGNRIVDPRLVSMTGGLLMGVHYIGEDSPAIDAAYEPSLFPAFCLDKDIEGKPRDGRPDVGAFENDGRPLLRGPLTAEEVGPNAPPSMPFSPDAPAVYITKIDLLGHYDKQAGWWGPIAVDIGVTKTGNIGSDISLRLLVDGQEVYRGGLESLAGFYINRGELSDGEHVLTVIAEAEAEAETEPETDAQLGTAAGWRRGEGHSRSISIRTVDFKVSNVMINKPELMTKVQGNLPVEIEIGFPEADLKRAEVYLDDVLIHSVSTTSSAALSSPSATIRLTVDSRQWPDRSYNLKVVAESRDGAVAESTRVVEIDNYWEILDDILPPIDWGFMGKIDRSKTIFMSEGWRYDTTDMDKFHGDADRLTLAPDAGRRRAQAAAPGGAFSGGTEYEYLVWETPLLIEARVTVYARKLDTEMIAGNLILSISADNVAWEGVGYRIESIGPGEGEAGEGAGSLSPASQPAGDGWYKVLLTAQLPEAEKIAYFRLALTADQADQAAGEEADVLQIGQVKLIGRYADM